MKRTLADSAAEPSIAQTNNVLSHAQIVSTYTPVLEGHNDLLSLFHELNPKMPFYRGFQDDIRSHVVPFEIMYEDTKTTVYPLQWLIFELSKATKVPTLPFQRVAFSSWELDAKRTVPRMSPKTRYLYKCSAVPKGTDEAAKKEEMDKRKENIASNTKAGARDGTSPIEKHMGQEKKEVIHVD